MGKHVIIQYTRGKKKQALTEASLITSMWGKARGLMFRKNPKSLIFVNESDQKVSLHMWFVFFSIDVLYLDKDKKVIEVIENFRPFAMYFPDKKSRYIVELPKHTISEHDLRLGQQLHF